MWKVHVNKILHEPVKTEVTLLCKTLNVLCMHGKLTLLKVLTG